MNILDLLSPETIRIPLESTEKRSAIRELIDLLHATGRIHDPEQVFDAVWEREQQRSTGIGEGLAIPHGKCESASELQMAIGCPAEPLEFDAFDRRPVRMIVLLASPPDRTSDHIQALGKISRIMSRPEFRDRVYQAENAEELYNLFADAEKALATRK